MTQKFFASFFQERRFFFSEEKKQKTFAFLVLCLASCQGPPPGAYVGGKNSATIALGQNAVGEACTQSAGQGAREADILCGTWDEPAAHVLQGDPANAAELPALASTSAWRAGLDRRLDCPDAPVATEILGQPGLLLRCKRRIGGWPHMAMTTVIGGRAYFADGVEPALPAMERSIGVLSGQLTGQEITAHQESPALAAQRLAAHAFSAGDVGQYETWMNTAASANRAGDYAAAASAYRSVAVLQQRVLGATAPALARTLAGEAVQESNLHRYNVADKLLRRADRLARDPKQTDENALALVMHDWGLHLLNQGQPAPALEMLHRSEAVYITNLHGQPLIPPSERFATHGQHAMASRDLFADPTRRDAIIGVVENRRLEAVALERLDRLPEGRDAALSASRIANANDLDEPDMQARLLRTQAFIDEAQGLNAAALTQLASSDTQFAAAAPGSPEYAKTTLLLAARQAASGQDEAALATCRAGIAALRTSGVGADPTLLMPCLKLMNATAPVGGEEAVHEAMFEAAELGQGSVTSRQIAEASARLAENARDPNVSKLLKEIADLKAHLADLLSEQQELANAAANDPRGAPKAADPALDAGILKAQAELAEKNSALQAASPNYASLVQDVVSAHDVMAALRPGEVFCSVMLADTGGWSFLVADGRVFAAPIEGGAVRMAKLVARIRASLDTETMPPPPFDTAASAELYQALLGGFAAPLQAASAITVAPTGPLLSLPFGLLLSGPAQADRLADAPWLVQHLVVAHVPAPANFVSLRKQSSTSRATVPWFGFGDFRPVTMAQADAAFPPDSCGDSATLLVHAAQLPGAQVELETVRRLTGTSPDHQLLGAAFTAEAVLHAQLKDVRILHFATHALLSTDLKCETEPALLTSASPKAPSADAALLTASQVTQLYLDADTVILSACNTGGGAAGSAGESLSGLARSFFYAGARSLLVTHWAVNDQVTAYLVALAVADARADPALGIAGGLAAAQRKVLADAKGDLAAEAHPFYWAPLAVIGDGRAPLRGAGPV